MKGYIMKTSIFLRGVACLLIILTLTASVASCRLPDLTTDIIPTPGLSPNTEPSLPVEYELTEAETDALKRKIDNLYVLVSKSCTLDELNAELAETVDGIDYVYTQSNVATILSNRYSSDEKYTEMKYTASDAYDTLYYELEAFYSFLYTSNATFRDDFFATWTEADVRRIQRHATLNLDEYFALKSTARDLYAKVGKLNTALPDYQQTLDALSKQIITANNAIAAAFGYANYVEYVSEEFRYGNDYLQVLEGLKKNVTEHLVPLAEQLKEKHTSQLTSLPQSTINEALGFTASRFDLKKSQTKLEEFARSVNMTTFGYYCDLMDRKNYYLITDNSVEGSPANGSFTIYLPSQDRSVMYFGNNENDIVSFIHMLGHYCTAAYNYGKEVSPEIAELQGSALEYLYLAFIRDQMSEQAYDYLVNYTLLNTLGDAVTHLALGELEHKLYTMTADELVAADLSILFEDICASYASHTEKSFAEIFDSKYTQRRNTVVNSNFFTSLEKVGAAASAMELYTVALSDYTAGTKAYFTLQFNASNSHSQTLAAARLQDPCSSDVCHKLAAFFSSDFLAGVETAAEE